MKTSASTNALLDRDQQARSLRYSTNHHSSESNTKGIVYISPIVHGPSRLNHSISSYSFDEKKIKKPCGKNFKTVISIIGLLFVGVIGAILNRIRGGFLNVPNPSSGTGWDVLSHLIISRLVIFAIPSGIMVSFLCKENKTTDPFYARRFVLGIGTVLFLWCSLQIQWGTYTSIGRNPKGYENDIGLFDWLIGHECESFQSLFRRRWTYEYVGLSFIGLTMTFPLGLFLFCFGYGSTFMVSGISMSLLYEIGWEIKSKATNFQTGVPIGELLFGFWFWLSLSGSLLSYRKRPIISLQHKSVKKQKLFHITILLVEFLLIGSCVGYSLVQQDSSHLSITIRNQTFIGVLILTSLFIMNHVFYIFSDKIAKCLNLKETEDRYWHFDESYQKYNEPSIFQNPLANNRAVPAKKTVTKRVYKLILPKGKKPYRFFLAAVRFVSICNFVLLLPLLLYVIIVNRIERPCKIEWRS